jgi:membrane fusion protein
MFRKQAVDNQFDKIWGEVNLTQALKYKVLVAAVTFMVITVLVFLFSADYHRKQRVQGYLTPSAGIIKAYAPEMVYVDEVLVKEGEVVQQDQPLVRLQFRRSLLSGQDMNQALREQLAQQLALLDKQAIKLTQVSQSKQTEQQQKIYELNEQMRLLHLQQAQLATRTELATTRLQNYQSMLTQGFVSQLEIDQAQEALLKLKQAHTRIDAEISTYRQQQATLKLGLQRLPLELEQSLQQNQLSISEKKSKLTQLSAQSKILIKATKAGHITALDIQDGQLLKAQQYMYTILPNDMELYAELLVPTRAFGFVEVGQLTRLKLHSFPYQKFGVIEGSIIETTEFVLLANEVKLPIELTEPVYKVKAKLNQQTMLAYGKQIKLQAGMKFNADIRIDQRSLMEWLFEPLLSLRE